MTLNREKRGHFNRLRAASHLEADLALLEKLKPGHTLIVKPSGKGDKYANDILIALLELTTDCDIVAFRRQYAKNKLLVAQSEILRQRFADFVTSHADAFPIAQVEDVTLLIDTITEGLKLLVFAEIDTLIGASSDEIELTPVDKEHFSMQLTSDAVERRVKAEQERIESDKLAEAKCIEAEKLEQKRIADEKTESERIEAEKKAESERLAAEQAQKDPELDAKQRELEEKEQELDEKESDLDEKEAELDEKESKLESDAVSEKKSGSKKKNTQTSNG